MKIGIIQPNFAPWRGYHDFIYECGVFVLHSDLQYTRADWRNRNKIKTPLGLRWLTVPVHYNYTAQLISEVKIDYSTNWPKAHLNLLIDNYRAAPYFSNMHDLFWDAVRTRPVWLCDVDRNLTDAVNLYLGIKTPVYDSRSFALDPALRKTERILAICKALGATTYLSGPAARVYLDEDLLRRNGIVPEYKVYDYPEYPQLHGKFEGNLSVLDLIANVGPDAPKYIWRKP